MKRKLIIWLLTFVLTFCNISLFACNGGGNNGDNGETETPLYTFGVLSDIHLKDTKFTHTDGMDYNSLEKYKTALTFYNNNNVDFISVAGDVVANSRALDSGKDQNALEEWASELQLFRQYSDAYSTKPVYAITGNHDAGPYGYNIPPNTLDVKIPQAVYGDGTKTAGEVWTEITGNELNYVIQKGDDVFIYFSMYIYNYVNFCKDESMVWLANQLETYSDKRVFLFFHLPYGKNLELHDGLIALDKYGNSTAKQFVQLSTQYPNVIWFSGHSHIDLKYETIHENANIYQNENSFTMVHVPACAYLREFEDETLTKTTKNYQGSQGLLVKVYENKVIIKGIDFTKGTNGEFISYINFVINTPLSTEES